MRHFFCLAWFALGASACSTGSALMLNSAMRGAFGKNEPENATTPEVTPEKKSETEAPKALTARLTMARGYLVQCAPDAQARLRTNHRASKCRLQSDRGATTLDRTAYDVVPTAVKADGTALSPGEKKLVDVNMTATPSEWNVVYRLGTSPLGLKLIVTRKADGVSEEVVAPLLP